MALELSSLLSALNSPTIHSDVCISSMFSWKIGTHLFSIMWHLVECFVRQWGYRAILRVPINFSKCSQFLLYLTTVFFPFSPSAGGLFPPGSGCVGAGGPHRIQGNCSSQPPAVHWCLHHPRHGRHALSSGLPGLLWGHSRKQVSPPLCESTHKSKT